MVDFDSTETPTFSAAASAFAHRPGPRLALGLMISITPTGSLPRPIVFSSSGSHELHVPVDYEEKTTHGNIPSNRSITTETFGSHNAITHILREASNRHSIRATLITKKYYGNLSDQEKRLLDRLQEQETREVNSALSPRIAALEAIIAAIRPNK